MPLIPKVLIDLGTSISTLRQIGFTLPHLKHLNGHEAARMGCSRPEVVPLCAQGLDMDPSRGNSPRLTWRFDCCHPAMSLLGFRGDPWRSMDVQKSSWFLRQMVFSIMFKYFNGKKQWNKTTWQIVSYELELRVVLPSTSTLESRSSDDYQVILSGLARDSHRECGEPRSVAQEKMPQSLDAGCCWCGPDGIENHNLSMFFEHFFKNGLLRLWDISDQIRFFDEPYSGGPSVPTYRFLETRTKRTNNRNQNMAMIGTKTHV